MLIRMKPDTLYNLSRLRIFPDDKLAIAINHIIRTVLVSSAFETTPQ